MKKLLLVDGSNLLFQMFYGMPARIIGKNGIPIHGVIGFVGALLKIIKMTAPTHIAVLFDGETHNPRLALDESYKANRPDYQEVPEEELPFFQLPYIEKALDLLGIPHQETEACEVDDWMASYVATYGCKCEIVISSFDSDFFQLISDSVTVLRYRGDATVLCTPAYLKGKYGIIPAQYADFKSLVGDTADNIKGVPSIGPKTAAKLLSTYGCVNSLYDNIDTVMPTRLQQVLIEHQKHLSLNRRLITLNGDAPLPFALDELSYHDKHLTTTEILITLGLK